MIKPKIIYLIDNENEDLFAIEFYGKKKDETFFLLCQPPFGQYEALADCHEDWFRCGKQIIELPRTYLDFQVDDFRYLDKEDL